MVAYFVATDLSAYEELANAAGGDAEIGRGLGHGIEVEGWRVHGHASSVASALLLGNGKACEVC